MLAPYTPEKISRLQCVAKKILRPKEKSHPPCLFNGRSLNALAIVSLSTKSVGFKASRKVNAEISRLRSLCDGITSRPT